MDVDNADIALSAEVQAAKSAVLASSSDEEEVNNVSVEALKAKAAVLAAGPDPVPGMLEEAYLFDQTLRIPDTMDRMQRMLAAWEEHLAHPALPRTLAAGLRTQGLQVTHVERYSILEQASERTGYAQMLMTTLPGFAPGRRGVTEEEAQAWLADLEALDR